MAEERFSVDILGEQPGTMHGQGLPECDVHVHAISSWVSELDERHPGATHRGYGFVALVPENVRHPVDQILVLAP